MVGSNGADAVKTLNGVRLLNRRGVRNLIGVLCGVAMAVVAIVNLATQDNRVFHGLHLLVAVAIVTACLLELLKNRRLKKYGHQNRWRGSTTRAARTIVVALTKLVHFLGFGVNVR